MDGWARMDRAAPGRRGARLLAVLGAAVLAPGLVALPADALAVPEVRLTPPSSGASASVSVKVPALPAPSRPLAVSLPPVTAPAAPTPAPALVAPVSGLLAKATEPVTTVVAAISPPLASIAPVVVPRPLGLVPSAPASPASLTKTPRVVTNALGPARAVAALNDADEGSSPATARARRAAESAVVAGGTTVRTLPRGREVQIVPRTVCSSQVAAVRPASPALCLSVTEDEAAALGLAPDAEASTSGIAGLPFTGASLIALALVGILAVAVGAVVRPFGRARRRAAVA